ncbi:MAG TPA: glycine betaine ABC transporter substrate-binding protein [Solirubrobacteraceae bacterium]
MTVRLPVSAAVALAALTITACSSSGSSTTGSAAGTQSTSTSTSTTPASDPGKGKPAIVIGDKNYTEQFLLGYLYSDALQAKGFSVSINPNIGISQSRMKQLQSGEITMYPEYLNVFNGVFAGSTRHFKTARAAYRVAATFARSQNLALLDYTPFSDTSGIATTVNFAKQNALQDVSDLAAVAGTLTVGGPPQLEQDPFTGLSVLEKIYGLLPSQVAYKSLEIGNQYKALDQNTVQAAYVNTTDGEFTTGNYTLLDDPDKMFGIGNVVPVVSAKMLAAEGPAFSQTINKVTALLTLPVIRELNAQVDLAGETPAGVASRFLADRGLIPAASAIES